MTFFLAGCQSIPTTPTGATDVAEIERRIVAEICQRAWKPQTYSSRDTEETQVLAVAGNASRAAYCRGDVE